MTNTAAGAAPARAREPWPRPDPDDVVRARRIRLRKTQPHGSPLNVAGHLTVGNEPLDVDVLSLNEWVIGALAQTPELEIQIVELMPPLPVPKALTMPVLAANHLGHLGRLSPLLRYSIELAPLGQWVQLLPEGPEVVTRGGGRFRVDLDAVIERSVLPLLIDHEHESIATEGKRPALLPPLHAAACGWVEVLVRSDPSLPHAGLWGRVRWCGSAERSVREGEYRYLAPLAVCRPCSDGVPEIERIASVALSNQSRLPQHAIEAFRDQCSAKFGGAP